ncbi:MAG: hypothetical protein ACRELG_13550 [Gemmataceae bacterium]
MLNPSASEPRGEVLPADRPSAPAAIRYPLASIRYPFWALLKRDPKPARSRPRNAVIRARLRKMKHGARGLLWWLPFWYIVGQLVLLAWIDDSWAFICTRVEHAKWKQFHARLAEAPDRPLVLALGSSRTDWAFQAARLNGQRGPDGRPLLAYNFGVPSTGPMHQALYLNDLLNEGIRPRLLLVEFVHTHFNKSQRELLSEEHFTTPQWLSAHQVLFLRPYYTNRRRLLLRWTESRLAPWYGFRYAIHEHLQGLHSRTNSYDQEEQPMDTLGSRMLYEDPNTPEFRDFRWACSVNMYGDSLKHFRLGTAGPVQALRDLLARCRREHIPVALVRVPMGNNFRALFPAKARADLDNLFAELSKGVHAIDASHWLPTEDMDDGHHVLHTGATKYTTRMIEEVHKILALTEPPAQQQATP